MSACTEIVSLLVAEPDGTLSAAELARLETHVAGCPDCRRQRALLRATPVALRIATSTFSVPSVPAEWSELRARLLGEPGGTATHRRQRRPWFAWSLPIAAVGAAAAFAILAFFREPGGSPLPLPAVAHADFFQAENVASTLVYVDQESGWLIVWADPVTNDKTTG